MRRKSGADRRLSHVLAQSGDGSSDWSPRRGQASAARAALAFGHLALACLLGACSDITPASPDPSAAPAPGLNQTGSAPKTGSAPSASEAPAKPANVLLVVFDTTRFDDWSYLDPDRSVTPVLDALAQDAQRFSSAYSLHTSTVPSHISMFTGHAALRRSDPPDSPLRDPRYGYGRSSLFTLLGNAGYRTYAFSGNKNIRAGTVEALEAVHVSSDDLHERMDQERLRAILERYGEYVPAPDALDEVEREAYLRHTRVIMGSAENVNAAALEQMREHASRYRDTPFFLFVNYNDAHDPYFPEPPFDTRFRTDGASDFNGNLWNAEQRSFRTDSDTQPLPARERAALAFSPRRLSHTSAGLTPGDLSRARDLHLGELAYADQQFGRLLAELNELGLLESTILVCVADHGELFGEHGRMTHAGKPAETLLHVPLLMRFPSSKFPPATHDERVDLRDIKPTLLAYLGIPDDSSRGRSLLPLMAGHPSTLPSPADGPVHHETEDGREDIVDGQDEETTRQLELQLKELGYIE